MHFVGIIKLARGSGDTNSPGLLGPVADAKRAINVPGGDYLAMEALHARTARTVDLLVLTSAWRIPRMGRLTSP